MLQTTQTKTPLLLWHSSPDDDVFQHSISLEYYEHLEDMFLLNHILCMNPTRTIPRLTISVFWLSPRFTQLRCLGMRLISFHNTCLSPLP